MTPEHFFLNSAQRLHSQVLQNALGSVRLSNYLKNSDANLAALTRLLSAGSKSKQKIVLMIGSPASGKSTFSKGFLHHIRNTEVASDSPCAGEWLRVNQDELSTLPKCIQAARRHLSSGSDIPRHVIVDNTNINKSTREQWVQLAHELDCEVSKQFRFILIIVSQFLEINSSDLWCSLECEERVVLRSSRSPSLGPLYSRGRSTEDP